MMQKSFGFKSFFIVVQKEKKSKTYFYTHTFAFTIAHIHRFIGMNGANWKLQRIVRIF